MRFKAKILGVGFDSTKDARVHIIPDFVFSRSKIWFTDKHKDKYYTDIFMTNIIQNESNYTFDKVYDKKDKKRFRIIYADGSHSSIIKLDWWNRIWCNWVHKRYLFQRDPDWFWKTLIAAGVGAVFGFVGGKVGYKSGFRDGIEYTKSKNQDIAPKVPSKSPRTDSVNLSDSVP